MSEPTAALPRDGGEPAASGEPSVPHADPRTAAAAAELEQGLRDTRPAAIGALLAGTTLLRIGSYGSSLVIPFVLPDLDEGRRATLVGALGATQAVSEMVFAPFLARWADRVGRSRFLVGGPLLGMAAVLFAWTTVHPAGLFVARFLEGVGGAAFVPTALGTIAAATSHNSRIRAKASGAFEAATLAGIALGFAVGGISHQLLGRGAFLVLALCYLAAAAVCLALVPKVPPLPVSPVGIIVRAIIGKGPIRSFLPAWLGTFGLLGAFAANLPSLLRRFPNGHGMLANQRLVHSLTEITVSEVLVAWIVLLVVGIGLWTPFLPRLGSAVTMRRAAPGAWVLALGLIMANHLPGDLALAVLPLIIVGVLWLAGFGPAAVAYLAECSETFAADRSALMAFYTVTLAAGGALGAFLGGLSIAVGHADGLFVFALACTVFTFISLGPVVAYERALIRQVGDGDQPDPRAMP